MKEVRSGYKRTKVGVIPMEWAVKKLGEIGDSKIGLTYSPDDVVDSKGLLVLRSSNIRNGSLVYEDNVFVNKEVKEELLTKENDILICARNGSKSLIGKNALITSKAINLTFGAFMSIYRSEYNKFLFQMFQTELYKKQISINLGATINQITTKNLNDFIFPIPPIHEQEKIAEILSTWDSAIEKQEQLIEKKKEFKKGLMQKLLSGEVRFKEFDDKWKKAKLDNYIEPISRECGKPSEGYWRLGLRSHGKGTFHQFVDDPTKVSMDKLYKVKANDLIVNITFAWEHAIAVANSEDEDKLVSHRFPTYEFKENAYSEYFKYYILQSRFREMLVNISPGGAGRNRVMNKKDFLKLEVLIPSYDEQKRIAEVLISSEKEIELLEKELEALKLQKKGLMQRLLTGEVRVKV